MADKQQQILEKQKKAALPTSQASLNDNKPASQMAARTAVAVAAVTSSTSVPSASVSNTTTSTSQVPNQTAQNFKFLQNRTPEKQQQLLPQRQALQQSLVKQQAQIKKGALEAGSRITVTSEPDIQSTSISRQRSKNITSQSSNLPNQFLKATPTNSSALLSRSSSRFALNKSISDGGSANSSPSGKLLDSKFKAKPLTRGKSKKDYSLFGNGVFSDDEEEDMEVIGVNLQVWYSVCACVCVRVCVCL